MVLRSRRLIQILMFMSLALGIINKSFGAPSESSKVKPDLSLGKCSKTISILKSHWGNFKHPWTFDALENLAHRYNKNEGQALAYPKSVARKVLGPKSGPQYYSFLLRPWIRRGRGGGPSSKVMVFDFFRKSNRSDPQIQAQFLVSVPETKGMRFPEVLLTRSISPVTHPSDTHISFFLRNRDTRVGDRTLLSEYRVRGIDEVYFRTFLQSTLIEYQKVNPEDVKMSEVEISHIEGPLTMKFKIGHRFETYFNRDSTLVIPIDRAYEDILDVHFDFESQVEVVLLVRSNLGEIELRSLNFQVVQVDKLVSIKKVSDELIDEARKANFIVEPLILDTWGTF